MGTELLLRCTTIGSPTKSALPATIPVIFALVAIWPPLTARADNLFNWNADNLASTSLGTIITVETGTTIDTTVKHSGAGSMKLNFPPGDVGSQTQMGVEPGGPIVLKMGQRYYKRWWMKFDSGFHWSSIDGFTLMKMDRVIDQNVNGCFFTQHLYPDRVSISECEQCVPHGPGGDDNAVVKYTFDPQRNQALRNWHEYIAEIKFNTAGKADGEYAYWVDGVEVGRVTGLNYCALGSWTPTERWGSTFVRPYDQIRGAPTDGGIIWADDFSLDTTWNSTQFVQGSGSGRSVPSAPKRLTVK